MSVFENNILRYLKIDIALVISDSSFKNTDSEKSTG